MWSGIQVTRKQIRERERWGRSDATSKEDDQDEPTSRQACSQAWGFPYRQDTARDAGPGLPGG